jgi:hypothetical protein
LELKMDNFERPLLVDVRGEALEVSEREPSAAAAISARRTQIALQKLSNITDGWLDELADETNNDNRGELLSLIGYAQDVAAGMSELYEEPMP